jgi:BRO family, N-terminal domain
MNETLSNIFGPEWSDVRFDTINEIEMHMAYDICKKLKIKNVTIAIRGNKDNHNVSQQYRTMEFIEDWNKLRTIHLLTIDGVFQLIMNNKTIECKRIKEYIAANVLAASPVKIRYMIVG